MVRTEAACSKQGRMDAVRRIHPSADLDTMSNEGWRCGPVLGSHLAHRSGPNPTTGPRRAAYITYNPASEGNRQAYFEEKRRVFPPEVERVAGRTYPSGPFNIGNPIDG